MAAVRRLGPCGARRDRSARRHPRLLWPRPPCPAIAGERSLTRSLLLGVTCMCNVLQEQNWRQASKAGTWGKVSSFSKAPACDSVVEWGGAAAAPPPGRPHSSGGRPQRGDATAACLAAHGSVLGCNVVVCGAAMGMRWSEGPKAGLAAGRGLGGLRKGAQGLDSI